MSCVCLTPSSPAVVDGAPVLHNGHGRHAGGKPRDLTSEHAYNIAQCTAAAQLA